jgi:hypothetical protein
LDDLEITLKNIFTQAAEQGLPTNMIADNMARERLRRPA